MHQRPELQLLAVLGLRFPGSEPLFLERYLDQPVKNYSSGMYARLAFSVAAFLPSEIMLIDEVLTPDSSRFWPAADYAVGRGQDSFDKQYVRNHLQELVDAGKWDKTPPGPELPDGRAEVEILGAIRLVLRVRRLVEGELRPRGAHVVRPSHLGAVQVGHEAIVELDIEPERIEGVGIADRDLITGSHPPPRLRWVSDRVASQ